MGKIIDNRCAKTCPNYQNLKKKNSEELRDLLKKVSSPSTFFKYFGITSLIDALHPTSQSFLLRNRQALEKQNEQLIEHEGPSSSYAKSITKELQWVNKLNPAKADKEAAKAGF